MSGEIGSSRYFFNFTTSTDCSGATAERVGAKYAASYIPLQYDAIARIYPGIAPTRPFGRHVSRTASFAPGRPICANLISSLRNPGFPYSRFHVSKNLMKLQKR